MSSTETTLSLDAEIDRLALLVAQRLAEKIRQRLSVELGNVENLLPTEPETAAPLIDDQLLADDSTPLVEKLPEPDIGRGLSLVSRDDTQTVHETPSKPLPQKSDHLNLMREAAQVASAMGFNLGDALKHCEDTIATPFTGDELGMELFRCAVRVETRARRDEERLAREREAAARRLAKMEERRLKIEQGAKKRQAEMAQIAPKSTPENIKHKLRSLAPVDENARKRVVIIGLLPAQGEMISHEFGQFFEIAVFGSDRIGGIKNVVKHADNVMVMIDFVSHAHINQIHGAPSLERVGGGMSSLRKALRDYYDSSYEMPVLLKA